jgi:hypothetical protein
MQDRGRRAITNLSGHAASLVRITTVPLQVAAVPRHRVLDSSLSLVVTCAGSDPFPESYREAIAVAVAVVFVLAFLVCHSELSERICFLPFFVRIALNGCARTGAWFERTHNVCGDAGKKREKADSLRE